MEDEYNFATDFDIGELVLVPRKYLGMKYYDQFGIILGKGQAGYAPEDRGRYNMVYLQLDEFTKYLSDRELRKIKKEDDVYGY